MGMDEGDGLAMPKKHKRAPKKNVLDTLTEEELMKVYLDVRKKLNQQIDKEIEARKGEVQFMADEYRKHRLAGMSPEQIHYDLCHPWR